MPHGGKESGQEGWRDGGMEGWRDGGKEGRRGALPQSGRAPRSASSRECGTGAARTPHGAGARSPAPTPTARTAGACRRPPPPSTGALLRSETDPAPLTRSPRTTHRVGLPIKAGPPSMLPGKEKVKRRPRTLGHKLCISRRAGVRNFIRLVGPPGHSAGGFCVRSLLSIRQKETKSAFTANMLELAR